MATLKCPICGKVFSAGESPAMPFCSHRCRQMDLGRWLDEKHTLPHVPSPEDDEHYDAGTPDKNGHEG